MAGVDFERVRFTVSMSQVLRLIGFTAKSTRGKQLRGACPLHESVSRRDRCFSVNLERNRYHCFQCGAFGNQIELWAAVRKQSVYAAAIELCEQLGMDVPWIHRW